jgi:hypothetical protein
MLIIEEPKKLQLAAQAFNEVECRKKEFFFSTSATRQGIEEVDQLNQTKLQPTSLHCRFSDNNAFTLTTNLISQANLSTILKELDSYYRS